MKGEVSSIQEGLQEKDGGTGNDGRGLWVIFALLTVLLSLLVDLLRNDGWGTQFLFNDSDPYLYFNRVLRLEDGAGWFDRLDLLANAPQGHEQHWTRPMDLIFWAGGRFFSQWMDFPEALVLWGSMWSPLLLLGLFFLMMWVLKPLGREVALIASALGVVQVKVLSLFRWGGADHHTLIMILWLLGLGFLIRAARGELENRQFALWMGVCGGLGMWVNLEGMVFVLVYYGAIGVAWLWGDERWARFGGWSGAATSLTLLICGLVEFGPSFFLVRQVDLIGFPILICFIAATGFWWALWFGRSVYKGRAQEFWRRLGFAALCAVGTAVLIALLGPEALAGPYGEVTELYREARAPFLGHHVPPVITTTTVDGALRDAVIYFGLPFAAGLILLRGAAAAINGRDERELWLLVSVIFVAFFLLTMYQRRWGAYLDLVAVIPYAFFAVAMMGRIKEWSKNGVLGSFLRPLGVVLLGLWPLCFIPAINSIAGIFRGEAAPNLEEWFESGGNCDLRPVAIWVKETLESEPRVTLLPAERGAEWIFRTRTGAIAIGNHRPQSGFGLKHEIFLHEDPAEAYRLMKERGIDLVLVCPLSPREGWLVEAGEPLNYYEALLAGEEVPGVHLAIDGDEAGGWMVYRVDPGDESF